jgi:radical SAM superfamily enzyme YgiQ (UPF0313 family)
MTLMREANFQWVFIGIESPDEESLKETLKLQNTREDMLTSLRRIYEHSIDIFAGFIIGFDHDTVDTFRRQHQFITISGIQMAMIGMLHALPRTPLYARLAAEGRLLGEGTSDNTRLGTNVLPKGMTTDQMRAGYQDLYARLLSDRGIADRIIAKRRHLTAPVHGQGYSTREQLLMLWRLLVRGIRPGGARRWWHFARTLASAAPRQIPAVAGEWIVGLSMRDYADRFLMPAEEQEARIVERYATRLRAVDNALEIALDGLRANVSLTLRNIGDRPAILRTSRHLRSLLRKSKATISIRIEA